MLTRCKKYCQNSAQSDLNQRSLRPFQTASAEEEEEEGEEEESHNLKQTTKSHQPITITRNNKVQCVMQQKATQIKHK